VPGTAVWVTVGIAITVGYACVFIFLRIVGEISLHHAVLGVTALAVFETLLPLLHF
jgi:hypothetical protein